MTGHHVKRPTSSRGGLLNSGPTDFGLKLLTITIPDCATSAWKSFSCKGEQHSVVSVLPCEAAVGAIHCASLFGVSSAF